MGVNFAWGSGTGRTQRAIHNFTIVSSHNTTMVCWLMSNQHLYAFLYAIASGVQKERCLIFDKISQVISRTTGPNIGLFVLILMHFRCWFQICTQKIKILKISKILWRMMYIMHYGTARKTLMNILQTALPTRSPRGNTLPNQISTMRTVKSSGFDRLAMDRL